MNCPKCDKELTRIPLSPTIISKACFACGYERKEDQAGNLICEDCQGRGGALGHPTADGSDADRRGPVWEDCETCGGNGIIEED